MSSNNFLQAVFSAARLFINSVEATDKDVIAFAQRYESGKAAVLSSRMIDCCGRLEMYLVTE